MTVQMNRTKLYAPLCLALTMFTSQSNASWLVENDVALGIEGGNLNYGFSMKFPYTADTSWQLMVNTGLNVNAFGGRFLSSYSQWNDGRIYWYGGASVWTWRGNGSFGSETALGLEAGIGWDYDLRNAGIDAPIAVNATAGPSFGTTAV